MDSKHTLVSIKTSSKLEVVIDRYKGNTWVTDKTVGLRSTLYFASHKHHLKVLVPFATFFAAV